MVKSRKNIINQQVSSVQLDL